jgi:hypothetical protein
LTLYAPSDIPYITGIPVTRIRTALWSKVNPREAASTVSTCFLLLQLSTFGEKILNASIKIMDREVPVTADKIIAVYTSALNMYCMSSTLV